MLCVCVCVCVSVCIRVCCVGGFARAEQKLLIFAYNTKMKAQLGLEREHRFLSDALACEVVSLMVGPGPGPCSAPAPPRLMLSELGQIRCVNGEGYHRVSAGVDLKPTRRGTNLPNKWMICPTLRHQMKVVMLHKFLCAGVNCLQSPGLYGR